MAKAKSTLFLTGWKVVIIDDEEDSLNIASLLLEMSGAEVHTASNGKEGLARIREVRPNFIISDLSMPERDGWWLIQQINGDRALAEIPCIALTAHAMKGDRDRAIQAGFFNYLTKPLDPYKFMTQLLRLLVNVQEFSNTLRPELERLEAHG